MTEEDILIQLAEADLINFNELNNMPDIGFSIERLEDGRGSMDADKIILTNFYDGKNMYKCEAIQLMVLKAGSAKIKALLREKRIDDILND